MGKARKYTSNFFLEGNLYESLIFFGNEQNAPLFHLNYGSRISVVFDFSRKGFMDFLRFNWDLEPFLNKTQKDTLMAQYGTPMENTRESLR